MFGMVGIRRVGTVPGGRSGGLLAIVLAVALLLCHGALGAHHQLHQTSAADGPPAVGHLAHGGHADAHGVAQGSNGEHGGCSACVAYAAVLLVVSLGALLWRSGRGLAWARMADPSLSSLGFVARVLRQARGPTLPVLQVFRL